MRKGFTLIELMAVVAIIAMMVAGSLAVSTSNRESARLKGAVRAVYATLRQARVTALVTCKPCEITYSTHAGRGDIKIKSAIDGDGDGTATPQTVSTISGEEIFIGDGGNGGEKSGRSLRKIFSPELPEELMNGISLKVVKEDDFGGEDISEEKKKSMLSVYSNVDYLLGRKSGSEEAGEQKTGEETKDDASGAVEAASPSGGDDPSDETVIQWEANGKCEAHKVWVYLSGTKKERGFCISVDSSGVAKVLDGREDDR